MSSIILTEEIRKIPYFSSFSLDEKEVVIPRAFVNESINYNNVEDIKLEDFSSIIENRVYLGLNNDELIRELLWRIGESEEKLNSIEKFNIIIQSELKPYLEKENYEYIYGIRCRVGVDVCTDSVKFGNLKLLKWARENGYSWSQKTCELAAACKRVEILKWLRENGCPWNEHRFCMEAIMFKRLDDLKFAKEVGCHLDESLCEEAAVNNRFEILKWLRDNGCPWDEPNMCTNVAVSGNLDMLKWVRESGCSWWDEKTCCSASASGNLELLKYLRENGCPWDEGTYTHAYEGGNPAVIRYVKDNGCPKYDGMDSE